jgi:alpha/beta superfamily hydrolase
VIAGADHFFGGRLDQLEAVVLAFAREGLAGAA